MVGIPNATPAYITVKEVQVVVFVRETRIAVIAASFEAVSELLVRNFVVSAVARVTPGDQHVQAKRDTDEPTGQIAQNTALTAQILQGVPKGQYAEGNN